MILLIRSHERKDAMLVTDLVILGQEDNVYDVDAHAIRQE